MRLLASLVAAGVAWRVFLALPIVHVDAALMSLALGVTPYALLLALGRGTRLRTTAIASAVAVLAFDVANGIEAMRATSSTGPVAVLLAPLLSALGVAVVFGVKRLTNRES